MSMEPDGFDSLNSTVIIVDEPGDQTVRPCSPQLRPILEAMREKMRRYAELRKQADSGTPPPSPEK